MWTLADIQKGVILYGIIIPRKVSEKFEEIALQYKWFSEKLQATLQSLRNDPLIGSIEFKKGHNCYAIFIAHYKLYYNVMGNHVKVLDIERVFHTW